MPTMPAAATARSSRPPRRWRSWNAATVRRPGQPVAYGETVRVGDVDVSFVPAGHVLGSAQIVLEHKGEKIVVSGDYKRRPDPTCAPFEPVPCDIFITEATFGLPVFRHPDTGSEIDRLLHRLHSRPEPLRAGRRLCARQGAADHLRAARARARPADLFPRRDRAAVPAVRELGVELGELRPATGATKEEMAGHIVIAPPGALNDRWSRRLPDPVTAMASGWMRIRQRARQRNVELPLVISDHADWDELTMTIRELEPERSVDHPRPRGSAQALVHDPPDQGLRAEPRRL